MSGYLLRLAATAGLRPSRIRPVVDALYAAGSGRPGLEAAQGEFARDNDSILVSLSETREGASPRPVRGARDEAVGDDPGSVAAPVAERRLVRREQDPAAAAIEPPQAQSFVAQGGPAAGAPAADFGRDSPRPVVAQSGEPANEPHEGFEFRAVASAAERGDHPPRLVRGPAAWSGGERDAIATPRRSAHESGQRTAPDEIRINIGRVEIVAAARPQPSAPAPPRKAMSLEDYLRGVTARRR